MRSILTWLCFSLLLVVSACKQESHKSAPSLEDLENQLMAVHDSIMPKMGTMEALGTKLDAELMDPALDSLTHAEIAAAMKELHLSDSLMWNWMYQYAKPEHGSDDSIRAYFNEQKAKISKVRDRMLKSIDHATALVQKLGQGPAQ